MSDVLRYLYDLEALWAFRLREVTMKIPLGCAACSTDRTDRVIRHTLDACLVELQVAIARIEKEVHSGACNHACTTPRLEITA